MFKVEVVKYDDLTEEQKEIMPNNGDGARLASYLKLTCGESVRIVSDAVEPEDAKFRRDFGEVVNLIEMAFYFGVKKGLEGPQGG